MSWRPDNQSFFYMRLNKLGPIDLSEIESRESKVRSADGTMVPLSIVLKRGLSVDGAAPAVLVGYGAYGITQDPASSPAQLAWIECGGVFAVSHIRGGGEYGEDWHNAGRMLTKQNTMPAKMTTKR